MAGSGEVAQEGVEAECGAPLLSVPTLEHTPKTMCRSTTAHQLPAQTKHTTHNHSTYSPPTLLSQVDSYLAHILSCLAQQPDVLEVEVNEEAAWRPAGSSAAFRPVLDAAGAPVVPGAAAWGAAVAGAGGGGGGAGGGGDSSDEEDEAAELRCVCVCVCWGLDV